eukprot:4714497-Pyramimonas_sp.AAC.1
MEDGRSAQLAIATETGSSTCTLVPDGLSSEIVVRHSAGILAASVWSSSPSSPPTAKPACPRCLTKTFKY